MYKCCICVCVRVIHPPPPQAAVTAFTLIMALLCFRAPHKTRWLKVKLAPSSTKRRVTDNTSRKFSLLSSDGAFVALPEHAAARPERSEGSEGSVPVRHEDMSSR